MYICRVDGDGGWNVSGEYDLMGEVIHAEDRFRPDLQEFPTYFRVLDVNEKYIVLEGWIKLEEDESNV